MISAYVHIHNRAVHDPSAELPWVEVVEEVVGEKALCQLPHELGAVGVHTAVGEQ